MRYKHVNSVYLHFTYWRTLDIYVVTSISERCLILFADVHCVVCVRAWLLGPTYCDGYKMGTSSKRRSIAAVDKLHAINRANSLVVKKLKNCVGNTQYFIR
jgi:hypothetical protein